MWHYSERTFTHSADVYTLGSCTKLLHPGNHLVDILLNSRYLRFDSIRTKGGCNCLGHLAVLFRVALPEQAIISVANTFDDICLDKGPTEVSFGTMNIWF